LQRVDHTSVRINRKQCGISIEEEIGEGLVNTDRSGMNSGQSVREWAGTARLKTGTDECSEVDAVELGVEHGSVIGGIIERDCHCLETRQASDHTVRRSTSEGEVSSKAGRNCLQCKLSAAWVNREILACGAGNGENVSGHIAERNVGVGDSVNQSSNSGATRKREKHDLTLEDLLGNSEHECGCDTTAAGVSNTDVEREKSCADNNRHRQRLDSVARNVVLVVHSNAGVGVRVGHEKLRDTGGVNQGNDLIGDLSWALRAEVS